MISRQKDLLHSSIISVSRVVKVVKGGRKFSFRVLATAGDGRGRFGIGIGKAGEVSDAKNKAIAKASNNMFKIPLREGRTIHHTSQAKCGAAIVLVRPAPPGTGIIAGPSIRQCAEVSGIKDVVVKNIGSSNPSTVVLAFLEALISTRSPKMIAQERDVSTVHILQNREKYKKAFVAHQQPERDDSEKEKSKRAESKVKKEKDTDSMEAKSTISTTTNNNSDS